MGFWSRRPRREPLLNARHRAARLAWAREPRDWKRVAWNDESRCRREAENMAAFGDGSCNFEPCSSDEDDTCGGTPSLKFHTTPTGGRLSFDIFKVRLHGRSSAGLGSNTDTSRLSLAFYFHFALTRIYTSKTRGFMVATINRGCFCRWMHSSRRRVICPRHLNDRFSVD
ncbi:hypothetical protein TNCV_3781331 [Trichonephila clavipes]|nr:hypothetical protein TNCV_3781331 [Trichonephila clavipes]